MAEPYAPGVAVVEITKLYTTLAVLRSTEYQGTDGLSALPIRVVPHPEIAGHYEVIDGFKRLGTAQDLGQIKVTVVIEEGSGSEAKALLIKANCPRRTIAPLDEARVIQSLVHDDGLTRSAVGRMLGRGRSWVCKRMALIEKLDASLHRAVDSHKLAFSLAYHLLALTRPEQKKLAQVIFKVGLSNRDGQALIATYRALESTGEKRALLADPLGTLDRIHRGRQAPEPANTASAVQALRAIAELSERLDRFMSEELPGGITQGEARLIAAERKRLAAKVRSCADQLIPPGSDSLPAVGATEAMPFSPAKTPTDGFPGSRGCFPGRPSSTPDDLAAGPRFLPSWPSDPSSGPDPPLPP